MLFRSPSAEASGGPRSCCVVPALASPRHVAKPASGLCPRRLSGGDTGLQLSYVGPIANDLGRLAWQAWVLCRVPLIWEDWSVVLCPGPLYGVLCAYGFRHGCVDSLISSRSQVLTPRYDCQLLLPPLRSQFSCFVVAYVRPAWTVLVRTRPHRMLCRNSGFM